jgi:adenylyltransferase/sulfurtransferase
MFSIEEKNQYQRHLSLPSFGSVAQGKLKTSSVLVIGVGGLGCPALQYLAAAGVGRIGIVDDDVVEVSNLQRQILFNLDDLGGFKSEIAAVKLGRMNPYIIIETHTVRFDAGNAKTLMDSYDIILDGTDNFTSRYLINDACILFDKILIYGAIYQFEGQLSVFNFKNGPTYRCLFPEPPRATVLPNCSEVGVLGVLPGIIGNFQALEAIKVITEIGEPLSGKVLIYDALTQKSQILSLKPLVKSREITELKENLMNCSSKKNDEMIVEIKPTDFLEMIKDDKDLLVVDVRENWEREMSKILPSIHIPLGEFSSTEGPNLPIDSKDSNIVIFCKAGVRSRMACESLRDKGFQKLFNLTGGVLNWESEGHPLS